MIHLLCELPSYDFGKKQLARNAWTTCLKKVQSNHGQVKTLVRVKGNSRNKPNDAALSYWVIFLLCSKKIINVGVGFTELWKILWVPKIREHFQSRQLIYADQRWDSLVRWYNDDDKGDKTFPWRQVSMLPVCYESSPVLGQPSEFDWSRLITKLTTHFWAASSIQRNTSCGATYLTSSESKGQRHTYSG